MVAPKATPVAQADFCRNLKPDPAAKLFIFSDFSFALAFWKVLFVFCILSPPRVAQSRLPKSHINVRFARQLKSTSIFKSHLKVRSARHKVDFGFQVASQRRLQFLSHILKFEPPTSKVDFSRIYSPL
jgi:hypothetical protein